MYIRCVVLQLVLIFFVKQKTAYEMRISDWSSDVCSSDLRTELSIEDVMESPMLWPGVMTRLMACPPTCGAAAAIIMSKEFARKHGLDTRVREIGRASCRERVCQYV